MGWLSLSVGWDLNGDLRLFHLTLTFMLFKQTLQTLIRWCILWHLIWVSTVCQCPKDPIFLTSWYMHIFFTQRFFKAAYPLGIIWIDCDICVITSNKWVQKIKGQYMNRSTFWMIKYMNGYVFSKARYMNGVGFEILARTPIPKLPLSYS